MDKYEEVLENDLKGSNNGLLVIVLLIVVVLPITWFVGWYMGASEAYQQGQAVLTERYDKAEKREQRAYLKG